MALGIAQNTIDLKAQEVNNTVFYDLKAIYDERRANMLLGQGVELKSDDDRFVKVFREIDKINKLDDLLLTWLQVSTGWGVLYATVGRNENNQWVLDFADPNFWNIVQDIELNVFGGRIRKSKWIGNIPYFMDEFYSSDGSVKRVFLRGEEKIPMLDWFNDKEVPKEFKLPEKEKFPFVPLFKYLNKPARSLVQGNNYSILREDYHIQHIPAEINLIFQQIYKHIIMSKDRIIGKVETKWLQDMSKSGNNLASFLGDMIITTEQQPNDNNKIEIQAATPKITEYMDGVVKLLNEYMRGRQMSPIDDSTAQQTEAETLFTKSLDVESCKIIKKRYTEFLNEVFDSIFIAEGLMNGEEEERPYALELKENIVFNEISLTTNLVEQINNRLTSRVEGIAKLRGIDEEKAREIKEQIDKEAEEDNVQLQQQLQEANQDNNETPPILEQESYGNTKTN